MPGGTLCPCAGALAAWLLGLGRGSSFPALAPPGSLTFCVPGLAGTPGTGSSPRRLSQRCHRSPSVRGPAALALLRPRRETWPGNALTPRLCLTSPPPLPSCRLSRPGAVPGCCHGLFLPQAAGKELGMLRPCLQPQLPPARRDEAVVRWHRMKTLCPGRVPSFPFPHTCCPDLCPCGTGRSLSLQVGRRGKDQCPAVPTGRAPRARGGCSPAAVALQDGCPLVMAGLHGGCPVRDLLLGPGPQPVSETRPPPSCFLRASQEGSPFLVGSSHSSLARHMPELSAGCRRGARCPAISLSCQLASPGCSRDRCPCRRGGEFAQLAAGGQPSPVVGGATGAAGPGLIWQLPCLRSCSA